MPVREQENQHDQHRDQQMDPPVAQERGVNRPAQPLNQYVEGVGAQLRQQKERHPQMGDGKPQQEQQNPDPILPGKRLFHFSSSAVSSVSLVSGSLAASTSIRQRRIR